MSSPSRAVNVQPADGNSITGTHIALGSIMGSFRQNLTEAGMIKEVDVDRNGTIEN
jgi:hypothetical protein